MMKRFFPKFKKLIDKSKGFVGEAPKNLIDNSKKFVGEALKGKEEGVTWKVFKTVFQLLSLKKFFQSSEKDKPAITQTIESTDYVYRSILGDT